MYLTFRKNRITIMAFSSIFFLLIMTSTFLRLYYKNSFTNSTILLKNMMFVEVH